MGEGVRLRGGLAEPLAVHLQRDLLDGLAAEAAEDVSSIFFELADIVLRREVHLREARLLLVLGLLLQHLVHYEVARSAAADLLRQQVLAFDHAELLFKSIVLSSKE